MRVGRALLYQQFGDLPVNVRLKRATRRRCFGLPDEHIWLQSRLRPGRVPAPSYVSFEIASLLSFVFNILICGVW